MTILITGASGFIGRHLARALEDAGYKVLRAQRPQVDLARDFDPKLWRERLRGVEVVINAAGLLREHGRQTFEAIHVNGPKALFAACAEARVKVVQLSALGADEHAETRFHRTKKQADDFLLRVDLPSVVLQPSLVFGPGGASARLFTALATLPLVPLPAGGLQRIQPVHIEDLTQAVVAIVRRDFYPRARVPVVGPAPVTLRDFLFALRRSLGFAEARAVNIPRAWVELASRLGGKLGALLDPEAWRMLERGNTADAGAMRQLLGREPRAPAAFIPEDYRDALRAEAGLHWLLPLLRVSIALVWITAGVVSAGLYPVEDSLALLERTGLTGGLAHAALYGAAALDFVLGVLTLALRRRTWLWLLQMLVILGYTAIITVALPEQWLHPYGPVVKNLPLLAALLLLYQMERK